MDNYYVSKLIPLMVEAQLHSHAQSPHQYHYTGPPRHLSQAPGLTRIPELRTAGINISFGHDCVMDPWYPLGQADMLEVASMGIHAVP